MTETSSIKLTDGPSIAIVESYQRAIGDKTAGRTLTRIIQAFHAGGGRLLPEPAPREVAEPVPQTT